MLKYIIIYQIWYVKVYFSLMLYNSDFSIKIIKMDQNKGYKWLYVFTTTQYFRQIRSKLATHNFLQDKKSPK